MSEINNIVELPKSIFFLKITDQYQMKYPSLLAKMINIRTKPVLPVKEVI